MTCNCLLHALLLVAGLSDFQTALVKHHIPSDGSKVGGTTGTPSDPTYIAAIPSLRGDSVLYAVQGNNRAGTNWPDGEFYTSIPSSFSGGAVSTRWEFAIDSNPSNAQAIEFTMIWIHKGYAYNGAFEILMSNGHLLVSSFNQPWTDTKAAVPIPAQYIHHTLVVNYDFDIEKQERTVVSVTLDGKNHKIHQTVKATASKWKNDEFTLQHQLAETEAGGLIVTELLPGCSIE
jgi:hypothetical protein